MPFYLVTHTSLVEADDEEAAARQTRDRIRSEPVKFSVRFDDKTSADILLPKDCLEDRSPVQDTDAEDQKAVGLPSIEMARDRGNGSGLLSSGRALSALMLIGVGISIGLATHLAIP